MKSNNKTHKSGKNNNNKNSSKSSAIDAKVLDIKIDESKLSTPQVNAKKTKEEIEQLQKEVIKQNRMLIVTLIAVLIISAGIFFGYNHFKQSIIQQQKGWTYENAVLEVYDGKINDTQYMINNIVFAKDPRSNLWIFQGVVRGKVYEISSHYNTQEVFEIPMSINAPKTILTKKAIVLTLNSSLDSIEGGAANAAIAAIELGKILGTKNNIFNLPIYSAATDNQDNNSAINMTVKCNQATNKTGVIQLEIANQTQISTIGNCVLIQGQTPSDLIRAADKLMFYLLGVMQLPTNLSNINFSSTTSNKTITI